MKKNRKDHNCGGSISKTEKRENNIKEGSFTNGIIANAPADAYETKARVMPSFTTSSTPLLVDFAKKPRIKNTTIPA